VVRGGLGIGAVKHVSYALTTESGAREAGVAHERLDTPLQRDRHNEYALDVPSAVDHK
jgi:hypothetical protein